MPAPTDLVRQWVDSALTQMAASSSGGANWIFISTISRIFGLLGPKGRLAEELRRLHDQYCSLKLDDRAQRAALESLRGPAAAELGGGVGEGQGEEFCPDLVAQHCQTDPAYRGAVKRKELAAALAVAQYGASYVLAWTNAPAELRPLLSVALDLSDPGAAVDAKERKHRIAAALEIARPNWPRLTIDVEALDDTSAHAFAHSFNQALFDAKFDRKPASTAKAPPRATLPEPDWSALEEQLFAASREAIAAFAKKNKRAVVSQLFFDANPPYEPVLICFDTDKNLEKNRAAVQKRAEKERSAKLEGPTAWRAAKGQLGRTMRHSAHDPGDFSHQGFADLLLEGVEAYSQCESCPAPHGDDEDGYVAGNLRILFWRVVQRLVLEEAFEKLTLARPVYLGYVFHEELPVVLRTL